MSLARSFSIFRGRGMEFAVTNIWNSLLIVITFFSLQYGPIVDIDLKTPPRPPIFAFVEVSTEQSLR